MADLRTHIKLWLDNFTEILFNWTVEGTAYSKKPVEYSFTSSSSGSRQYSAGGSRAWQRSLVSKEGSVE
jgi:hypothetical protein